jgi:hypothetical protein
MKAIDRLRTGLSTYRETSRIAYESIQSYIPELHSIVVAMLEVYGDATADEIQVVTGLGGSTVRPRIIELQAVGVIIDTPLRRPTRTGRPAKVIKLAPEYRPEGPMIQEKLLELEIDELVEAGDLDAQILRYAALKADLKILEAQAKRFGAKIIAQLFEQGQVDYAVDDAGKASIGTKTTRTIQPGLLLANGVDAHTIEACTKVSTSDPFLTWRRKGEKETEAD